MNAYLCKIILDMVEAIPHLVNKRLSVVAHRLHLCRRRTRLIVDDGVQALFYFEDELSVKVKICFIVLNELFELLTSVRSRHSELDSDC